MRKYRDQLEESVDMGESLIPSSLKAYRAMLDCRDSRSSFDRAGVKNNANRCGEIRRCRRAEEHLAQCLHTERGYLVNSFDVAAGRPLPEHFFCMFHCLASVNAQAFRSESLLQQAALLSPLSFKSVVTPICIFLPKLVVLLMV